MTKLERTCVAVAVLLLPLMGCARNDQPHGTNDAAGTTTENEVETSVPVLAATNVALKNMTKAIVGDYAEVIRPDVQTGSGTGLDTKEVLRLQAADLVVTNGPGANDAAWLDLVSLDASRIHATTGDEFALSDFIQVQDYRTVHSHGDQGEHSHPWLVPHCWLSPRLARAQSLSLLNRLIQEFPEQESVLHERYRALDKQLKELEALAEEMVVLLQANNINVIASDPRLLFFTRSLEMEDEYFLWFELPKASAAVAQLQKRVSGNEKSLLLWAQDAGSLSDELAQATGVAMTRVDLIERDVSANYVEALRGNYESIRTVVGELTD